jgi:ring-1,2-phenylacetyl-CoA epoxidase subunit PaaC
MNQDLIDYSLHLADNALIFGHRLSEWCGHAPALELDMALSNIALDNIGAARLYYQYAAELIGDGATEDSLAYLRKEREFKNQMLVEQPNGDFAHTLVKIFFFSNAQQLLYTNLASSSNERLASIAAKSLKEVNYHVNYANDWLVRLGDGTDESKERAQNALNALWAYSGEYFMSSDYEKNLQAASIIPVVEDFKAKWTQQVQATVQEATLTLPDASWFHSGGKNGLHSEHLGYILAEMQYLQRAYPGAEW